MKKTFILCTIILTFICLPMAFCLENSISTITKDDFLNLSIDERVSLLDYPKIKNIEINEISKNSYRTKYAVKLTGTDIVTKKDLVIELTYRQNYNKNAPVIILPPNVIGETIVERSFARAYQYQGFHTINIKLFENIVTTDRHTDGINRIMLAGVTAIRMAIDFAKTRTEIKKDAIGLHGISLGAIMGSLTYTIDKRINSAIFMAGGSDFPYVLAHSTQYYVKRYRNARMKAENFKSVYDLEQKLRNTLIINPAYFVENRNDSSDNTLLILATGDTVVPTATQVQLWNILGRPERIDYEYEHIYMILISAYWEYPKIFEFMKEQLK